MGKFRIILFSGLTFFIEMFFSKGALAQCVMCKANAEAAAEENGGSGINAGIIFMIVVVYVILFFLFRKKVVKFFKEFSQIYDNV